jgi:FAD:protein FMN transferase
VIVAERTLQRHGFRSMAVSVECLVAADDGVDDAFAAVEEEFRRLEQIFSRFRPDSELSLLNAAGFARCGDELIEVVELALRAREQTRGRFDPTVHDALVAAGYDRTFADVAPDADGPEPVAVPAGGSVEVHADERTIRLGPGVRLDLGGIVKGYAAERACELLQAHGPCLVNAAGDVAVRGVPPEGVWPIGLETPAGPITLGLGRGGVATSGRDYRRWTRNGRERHHLIDPFTGTPSASDLVCVTAVGATAIEAEVRAKALFLVGSAAAVEEADRYGIPCLLVTEDERVLRGGGLA